MRLQGERRGAGLRCSDEHSTDHPGSRLLARRVGLGRGRRPAAERGPRRHGADPSRARVEGRRPVAASRCTDHVDCDRRRDRSRRTGPSSSSSTAPPGSLATRRATAFPRRSPRWSTSTRLRGSGRSIRTRRATRPSSGPRSSRARTSTACRRRRRRRCASRPCRCPAACSASRSSSRTTRGVTSRATLIATGFTSEDYKKYAAEEPVMSWLAGIRELRNATWIDLPTSHWPMWSKPKELAEIIGNVAKAPPRAPSEPATARTRGRTARGWRARRPTCRRRRGPGPSGPPRSPRTGR